MTVYMQGTFPTKINLKETWLVTNKSILKKDKYDNCAAIIQDRIMDIQNLNRE